MPSSRQPHIDTFVQWHISAMSLLQLEKARDAPAEDMYSTVHIILLESQHHPYCTGSNTAKVNKW